ncbi:MAG: disulfide bond formation protein B [Rhizomicrobium sp.]
MNSLRVAWFEGAVGLTLILGALFFQYALNYPPCEMCHWQRWPHIAAAVVGLGGALLIRAGLLPPRSALAIAALAVLGVAVSGGLGVYHAGVEWQFWPGPTACTTGFHFNGGPLDINAPVPHCDHPAWTLFGISLAGYNALISLAAALFGAVQLVRKP